jgi:hypothetical protein
MGYSTDMNKPPECSKCGSKERLIGAELGAFIFFDARIVFKRI